MATKAPKIEVLVGPAAAQAFHRMPSLIPACTVKATETAVETQVTALTGGLENTVFSIWDGNKVPDLWSNDPVFPGKVILWTDYWRITHQPQGEAFVQSPVLENAPWKDVLLAVEAIIAQGDGCGVFLEGFEDNGLIDPKTGSRILEIAIGS